MPSAHTSNNVRISADTIDLGYREQHLDEKPLGCVERNLA